LNGYPLLKFRVSSSYLRSSLNVTLVDWSEWFWICYLGSRDTFIAKYRRESVLNHWSDQYNSHHALRRPRSASFVAELTDRSLVVGSMQRRVVRRMIDERFLGRDSSEMFQRGWKFGLKNR
jgi:hypothetical protein